jgi:Protein of unknown function (DUF3667)
VFEPIRGGGVAHELETAAADSVAGILRGRRRREGEIPPGTPCANCATPLLGPWCYRCGQAGEDFHRSIRRLVVEVFEGLFHFDGRVWTTLPDLMLRPGRLTRAYLDGHRAPQIPPLRLFLVVLLAVFFVGALGGGSSLVTSTVTDRHGQVISRTVRPLDQLTPAERAQAKKEIARSGVVVFNRQNRIPSAWLSDRLGRVLDDPERFRLVLEQWSERFAFLALPLAAGLLSLLFVFQRRFYVFDHTIFSLHSLSAVGLMLTVAMLFSKLTGGLSNLLLLAAPAHLFAHMRGVYGTGVFGTLVRMAFLLVGSFLGALAIFFGLLLVGLNGMGTNG